MNFSIIIPAYNCETTLERTVDSIQKSGLTDYEIWLIEDGSADGTPAVCDVLCSRFPEVHCIHQENAGVSAARNRGLEVATGEYILFFDADDTVEPGSLREAGEIVSTQKPDLLIFGMRFDYYHEGKCYRRDELVPPVAGMISEEDLCGQFELFYETNSLTPVWNKFYRREILQKYAIRFHAGMILMEDFLFVLEALPYCEKVYCLPQPIYEYRQSEDEKNSSRRLQRIPDLGEYLQPFEQSIRKLNFAGSECFVREKFYPMLLQQKLYYASLPQIRQTLAVHAAGPYASISFGKPMTIYLKNQKTQLRHRIAVAVKSLLKP